MKHLLTVLILFVVGSATSSAETPAETTLQMRADALREETGAPAIAILVMRDGAVVDEVASGVRASNRDISAAPGDTWHLGSITKSMTATLVARLAEADEISWDLTVGQALGESVETIDPGYVDLTFTDLFTHTSGLPANIGLFKMIDYDRTSPDARDDRLDYAANMLSKPPRRAAGEGFEYSNAGYVIAGAMVEQVMGERWEDLVTAHVFAPLGTASAGFGPVGDPEVLDQPRGHRPVIFGMGRRPVSPDANMADNPEVLGPAGRAHMTLEDLAIYGTAHLTGETPDGASFLSAESLSRLHTPRLERYAMGWVVRDDEPNEGLLWHNGSNTINYSELYADPGSAIVVAMAANDHDARGLSLAFRDVARDLLTAYSD